ncbi:MAG: homoserine dehydrogenase [Polyangiaceae bacterium]
MAAPSANNGSASSPSGFPPPARPVHVSLLGCGTVGGGVLRLLQENADRLSSRIGAPLVVRKVLVRDLDRARVPECDRAWLTTNPRDVLDDPETDIVVEVMGGIDPASSFLREAIANGKQVVTANKALLAHQGPALVEQAVKQGVDLAFEASVGGGIPVIRTLREALISDKVEGLTGIVNGTCNFVLTRMRHDGLSFADALADAQARGYAEADPTLDVDGHDAAQKLIVLAMLAFGTKLDPSEVPTAGIRDVDAADHRYAARFGYVVKHLAIGRDHGDSVELRVHPALVPADSVLASISGVLNALQIQGKALGPCLLSGRGAGDLPTAVSVVADLVEVARSRREGAQGLSTRGLHLKPRTLRPADDTVSRFYLRFSVVDRPGVLAAIAGILGENEVSIEQMVQEGRGDLAHPVDIVMITHAARYGGIRKSLAAVAPRYFVAGSPRVLRIEDGQ